MSPRIFGSLFVGNMVLLICCVVFCWVGCEKCGRGFVALRVSWFCLVQLYISCRYGCTCCCAMPMCGFVCVDKMVVSSAYVTVVMFGDVGVGRSPVYMLKTVGESTPPCGTPVFVFLSVDL